MKISKASIRNFRHIDKLDLDFTDSFGKIRDLLILSGPNTSGKTTVLDAIGVAAGLATGLPHVRPSFSFRPSHIVRKGALNAMVSCEIFYSPEEISATAEILRLAGKGWKMPSTGSAKVTWQFPDPRREGRSALGFVSFEPRGSWVLFKGRSTLAELLSTRRAKWDWFEKVGAVFVFDQQRTGSGKTIPQDVWNIIHSGSDAGISSGSEEELSAGPRRTKDPRDILLSLAVRSQIRQVGVPDNQDEFALVRKRYEEICSPRSIKGVVRDELGDLDILFSDGRYDYGYDNMSSGEQMVLLFLLRMVTEHVHNSIVLIDELELHQHPIWQRQLLDLIPRMGKNNQIIASTHSPYLRDVAPRGAVFELGHLGDKLGSAGK